jgi:hypothetical protein
VVVAWILDEAEVDRQVQQPSRLDVVGLSSDRSDSKRYISVILVVDFLGSSLKLSSEALTTMLGLVFRWSSRLDNFSQGAVIARNRTLTRR